MFRFICVGVGGFLGAGLRFLMSQFVQSALGARFPYGTLSVNVVGSFLLTLLAVGLFHSGSYSEELRLLVLTGLLGAFTTFSTFSHESLMLLREGLYRGFALNVIGNVVLCLLGSLVGFSLGLTLR